VTTAGQALVAPEASIMITAADGSRADDLWENIAPRSELCLGG